LVRSIHAAVKGRVRFRIDGLYRSNPLKKYLEDRLAEEEEITGFSANFLSGHALVFFDPELSVSTISLLIQEAVRAFHQENGNHKGFVQKKSLYETFFIDPPLSAHKRASDQGPLNPPAHLPAGSGLLKSAKPKLPTPSRRKTRQMVLRAADQRVEPWHLQSAESLLVEMGIQPQAGLSDQAVKERQKKYGPNILSEAIPRSGFSIFIDQFKSLPVALLGVAAGISVATGGLVDAVIILSVVVINAVIGYVTESQAEKTIHSLKSLIRPMALVIREGSVKTIGSQEVLPGDLLVLQPGSYIAADARLIEVSRLSVDESVLTGESLPALKSTGPILDLQIPLADRTNMVYMGTLVTGGQGLALAVATGRYTEIGKIQALVGEALSPETPMEKQLDRMGGQLVTISLAVCGLVFVIGLLRGYGLLQMLKTSIALAVAAVPEGLPMVATTTLALGLRRMREYKVLIRHLGAVETLGSVQTICMDKTGTITMNHMSVRAVYVGMEALQVTYGQFLKGKEPVDPYDRQDLLQLIHVGILCNESEIEKRGYEEDPLKKDQAEIKGNGLFVGQFENYLVSGSPTENALIHLAISAGINIEDLKTKFPTLQTRYRSEEQSFMITLHKTAQEGRQIIAVKGSPSEVLALCQWQKKDGHQILLTDEDRLLIEMENERMAGKALRVLGMAYLSSEETLSNSDPAGLKDKLIWLGLVGMGDPIRDGVKELIKDFHQAGIDTVMITGDQTSTAYAIGKELNLSRDEELQILDSTHIDQMDPEVLQALAEKVHVFARVSPSNKLQIVQAMQKKGKVVAMTGDGINDGPALKVADIGVAMGHTGTDVAREVADVVLEDDHLETMVIAVRQGRTIYNNIRKSLHFLLSTNMSEIMVVFAATAGGLGHPMNAMQLLWINLISDIFPGLALALEAPEPDVLTYPPRNPEEPIMRKQDFKRIFLESSVLSAGTLGVYGYGLARYGQGPQANTLAFMTLSCSQLLHAYSCRSETHTLFSSEKLPSNRLLNLAVVGSLAVQAGTLIIPGMRGLLGLRPLSLFDSLLVGGASFLPLLINESTKSTGKKQ
jgi:Ca2+-transporting ATPase